MGPRCSDARCVLPLSQALAWGRSWISTRMGHYWYSVLMVLSIGWLLAKCFSSEPTERRPPVVYTGQSVKRFEDPRLLTGQGTFLDDLTLPGMLHAAVLRSPHAHAHITSIETAVARRMPGVVAVLTAEDLEGVVEPLPTRQET